MFDLVENLHGGRSSISIRSDDHKIRALGEFFNILEVDVIDNAPLTIGNGSWQDESILG